MLALALTDTKDFMNKLLRTELFDHFLIQEASIRAGAAYHIDGRINRDFYDTGELEELGLTDCRFLPFAMLREPVFHLFKGKKPPSSFRLVLLLSPENMAHTLECISSPFTPQEITGMFFNISYQNGQLLFTSGVSYAVFSADKALDDEWGRMAKQFLKQRGISYEEL